MDPTAGCVCFGTSATGSRQDSLPDFPACHLFGRTKVASNQLGLFSIPLDRTTRSRHEVEGDMACSPTPARWPSDPARLPSLARSVSMGQIALKLRWFFHFFFMMSVKLFFFLLFSMMSVKLLLLLLLRPLLLLFHPPLMFLNIPLWLVMMFRDT